MQEDTAIILMVDDRWENLLALEAVLQSPSYRLVSTNSGEEALRYVLQLDNLHRLALILMDVQMPGMDGYETATLMRERKELRNVPIIFITATYKSKSNVKRGYLTGSIDYIFKPYDPDILRWKVENFINLYRYQQELQRKNALLSKQFQELEWFNQKLVSAKKELLLQQEMLERTVEARTRQLRDANKAMEQSNRRFRAIFYTNPNLIAIRQLSDGKFLEVNRMWEQATGYSLEQMVSLGERALWVDAGEQETSGHRKIQYYTRNGDVKFGLLSVEPFEVNEEWFELIVITDITEREALQKHLNRSDRLHLIGEMAAGIAHEIRNPMTTIQGFLQMWKRSEKPLPKEHIDLMLSELMRANKIITEYLSLAGNKESDLRDHPVEAIIDSLFPLLQAVAVMDEKQLVVHNETERLMLRVDEKEMRQVIINLAKNGLEAMDSGGVLIIRTYAEGEEAVIDVVDEGPGIPKEVFSKLGTPFFTTKEKGTGLGLALCYSIVERHRGKINVKSGPGGTTFSVRLPVVKAVLKVYNEDKVV